MPPDAFDVDEFIASIVPRRSEAVVCHRQDLARQHEVLEAALAEAQKSALGDDHLSSPTAGEVHRVAADIAACEAEMEVNQRTFVFRAIGKRAWADLIAEHPPTDKQRRDGLDHNPATFPDQAIAASSESPKLTVDQVARIAENLSFTQWRKLWAATLDANLGDDVTPKSLAATVLRRLNGGSSTTAPPEASPAASS